MTVATRIGLRPAVADDDSFRRLLFAQSRPELAALPSAVREQLLDLQWRAQARQYEADHPHARRSIIECDSAPVGQLVVDDSGDPVRLVDIAVATEHRGRGIARAVLAELVTTSGVLLSVWSDNAAARHLYEQLGFQYLNDGDGYLQMRRTHTERVVSR